MSYNPNRFNPATRTRRQPNPRLVVKHSDIVQRHGIAAGAPIGERKDVPGGVAVSVFDGEDFSVEYKTIFAGSNTAVQVNDKGDQIIRVLSGVLYATLSSDRTLQTIQSGQQIVIPRGTPFELATSGTTHTEVFIVKSKNYDKNLKVVEGEKIVPVLDAVIASPEVPSRRDTNKAQQQAAQQAEIRRKTKVRRETADRYDNVNSANSFGVNPRPMGPPPSDD